VTQGALVGLRVLDLSRVLAGPWTGQILADLGAEVIKVERPGRGDDTRHWGPPYLRDEQGAETSESAYFLAANRGKTSVAIDIAQPEGQDLIRRLANTCDVLLENFKVGGLSRYGLDYDSLRAVNPKLIYCSITGFGQTGPYRQKPGYDFMIQAMGGLMSITGEADGQPGAGPQKVGVALADIITGLYTGIAVLAALAARQRSGQGQHIDMALLDCQVAVLANQAMNYLTTCNAPGRLGNAHPNIVPYQVFASADGHFILAVGNDNQFGRLCHLLGRKGWEKDPRFATNALRVENRETLVPLLAQEFLARNGSDWLTALEAHGIPCGPINTIDKVFADPQVLHRDMKLEIPHATAGRVPSVGSPIKLSETPVDTSRPPPMLGEHTDEVLSRVLDCNASQLADYRRRGVIA
jgi:crotonobetainyl-CoA:carnitine CoA-transferase CaiB-like acyl-CoA transferase